MKALKIKIAGSKATPYWLKSVLMGRSGAHGRVLAAREEKLRLSLLRAARKHRAVPKGTAEEVLRLSVRRKNLLRGKVNREVRAAGNDEEASAAAMKSLHSEKERARRKIAFP